MTEPHEHKMCDSRDDGYMSEEGLLDPFRWCCLCHPHEGCELVKEKHEHQNCNYLSDGFYGTCREDICCTCHPEQCERKVCVFDAKLRKLDDAPKRWHSPEYERKGLTPACPESDSRQHSWSGGVCGQCGYSPDVAKNDAEPTPGIRSTDSVGWGERFEILLYQYSAETMSSNGKTYDKRKEIIDFIRTAVREAKLEGFDEAYKITAKSNTSEEAYSRLEKKRTELEEGKA